MLKAKTWSLASQDQNLQQTGAFIATSLDPLNYGDYGVAVTAAMLSLVAAGPDLKVIKVENLTEPIRFSLLVDDNRDTWQLKQNREDMNME